ncbi:MAG: hypothetical protein HOO86_13775 [Bacteroidales bacterium]|nr:hypothetical protein [Bacteroidales bacterium]
MKRNIKLGILFIALVASTAILPFQAKAQQPNVSFQIFYDELSPYGEWVDYPNYGYVWIPDAGPDFAPYSTRGQWIFTDYGWTWVSNYEWGWAPFHYGRWDYDNYYGWIWVPDNEWGPSWVTWVSADDYYGWQPMQPGISINISLGRDYRNNHNHWTFVRYRDFERDDIQHYYVDRSDHERIIHNSTVINQTYIDRSRNTTYISGPSRDDVQRVTGNKVRHVSIQENDRPGQDLGKDRLRIYRPEVKRNIDNNQKSAPRKVSELKDVKRPSERTAPDKSRDLTPAGNNRQDRQQKTVYPRNDNKQVQPDRQRKVSPSDNNRQDRQQKTVTPQNDNKQVQPAQQRKVNPSDTKRQERQKNKVSRQKENQQVQPAQKQNAEPTENKKQANPEKTVKPEKTKRSNRPRTT